MIKVTEEQTLALTVVLKLLLIPFPLDFSTLHELASYDNTTLNL
jgi:hypothetical protein